MNFEVIKSNIQQFQERLIQQDTQREIDQQSTVLSSVKKITLLELREIQKDIQLQQENIIITKDQINFRTQVLKAARCIHSQCQEEANEEMQNIELELINFAANLQHVSLRDHEDIESLFSSGFMIEMLDLIRRTDVDLISSNTLRTVSYISENGTAEQSHKLFMMNTIQILTPKLKSKNFYIQRCILWSFFQIVRKGWIQSKLNIQQNQNISSIDQQSLNCGFSSQLNQQQPQIFQQQLNSSNQSLFPNISFKLQNHFLIQHPYLITFEKQGVYRKIIEDILANKEVELKTKLIYVGLLDIIFVHGVILPVDIRSQIIKDFCTQAKSNNDYIKINALKLIVHLSVNKENHEAIINEEFLESILEYFRKIANGQKVIPEQIKYSITILQQIFIFGSNITKRLIRKEISTEILNKLKENNYYEQEATILESIFADPETLDILMKVLRFISYKIEEKRIEMIEDGLLSLLKQEMEKMKLEEEGKIIKISQLISQLSNFDCKISQMIIEENDFLVKYLSILSAIPMNKIKECYLEPINRLSSKIGVEFYQKLYQMGIVQLMMKMLNSLDIKIQTNAIKIISNIIKGNSIGLKDQDHHPYLILLANLGYINQLIILFKNDNLKYIHEEISIILANIFKALPVPSEIRKMVINQLNSFDYFDELGLLAENQSNHNIILQNILKENFIKNDKNMLSNLHLKYQLIQFGTNEMKRNIINQFKDQIEQLIDDEQLNKLVNLNHWEKDMKEKIKMKAKDIHLLIEAQKNEVNYKTQDLNYNKIQNQTNDEASQQQSNIFSQVSSSISLISLPPLSQSQSQTKLNFKRHKARDENEEYI